MNWRTSKMKQTIANENLRDFLSMAKRLTPYLTDSEFETVLKKMTHNHLRQDGTVDTDKEYA